MFQNVVEFSYERNWKQAAGFYLTYVVFTFILFAILSAIFLGLNAPSAAGDTFNAGMNFARKVGPIVNIAMTVILSFLVMNGKKTYSVQAIGCALVAVLVSVWGGVILSLIPVAYLTMLPKANKS